VERERRRATELRWDKRREKKGTKGNRPPLILGKKRGVRAALDRPGVGTLKKIRNSGAQGRHNPRLGDTTSSWTPYSCRSDRRGAKAEKKVPGEKGGGGMNQSEERKPETRKAWSDQCTGGDRQSQKGKRLSKGELTQWGKIEPRREGGQRKLKEETAESLRRCGLPLTKNV